MPLEQSMHPYSIYPCTVSNLATNFSKNYPDNQEHARELLLWPGMEHVHRHHKMSNVIFPVVHLLELPKMDLVFLLLFHCSLE